ncbi:MAG: phenylalanine--tRNA ligase subunit alpha [Enterobacteriaceae bacterium]
MIKYKNLIKILYKNILNFKKLIKFTNELKKLYLIKKKFLGKNSKLQKFIKDIKKLDKNKKPKFGNLLNRCKNILKNLFLKKKNIIESKLITVSNNNIDITLPGRYTNIGKFHPISEVIKSVESIFNSLNFNIIDGLEIEDEYHNFDMLNFKKDHPSRSKNDTFWINSKILLRTHTSNMQVRAMRNIKPPMKILASGKVYRRDNDKNHLPMFHQIEGFIIQKNVNFANLKYIIFNFIKNFFKKNLKIRFRPSFFPFTKPSAEVDIKMNNNWIEVIGCGLINKKVFKINNIDSNIYSGLAFGIGVERLAMIKYNLKNIRVFFENNLHFLKNKFN